MSWQRRYAFEVLSMLFRNGTNALAAAAALILLSACGANPGAALTPSMSAAARTAFSTPRADTLGELAYVLDSTGDVDVYSYPGFVKQQTLSGFSGPQGECVDAAGDVWIVDTNNARFVEYAHGGSQPIATLSDSAGTPVSCAVSSSSGTLAAANIVSKSYGPGNVVLYPHAKGSGTVVSGSGKLYFLAYDSHDDLFGDGLNGAYQFVLSELPKNAKAFQIVGLAGATIGFPGAVQYVKDVLNIGDQEGAVTYQTRVKKDVATVTGSIPLDDSSDCVATFIYKHRLLCPDAGSANLKIYAYPKGGAPIRTLGGIDGTIVISAVSEASPSAAR
jgi:hypothetical protein